MNKITIRMKVIALSIIGIITAVVIAGSGVYGLAEVGKKLKTIAHKDIPLTDNVMDITVHQLEQAIAFERAARFAEMMGDDEHALEEYNKEKENFDAFSKKVTEEMHHVEAFLKKLEADPDNALYLDEILKTDHAIQKIDVEHEEFEKAAHRVFALFEAGELLAAEALTEEVEHQEEQLDHKLEELLHHLAVSTEKATNDAEALEQHALETLGLIVAIGILLSIIISFVIIRSITVPLKRIQDAMKKLAGGDLDAEIPEHKTQDELADLVAAVEAFRAGAIVQREKLAQKAKDDVAEAAARGETIDALVNDFDQTSSGLLESMVAAAIEMEATSQSMTSIADQTSKQAEAVSLAADEAGRNVNNVASATEELTASIQAIGEQITESSENTKKASVSVQETKETMTRLAESANKIGDVVSLITDIAEQTNLLALNATIEAARAGDAGRGFAVVATEVKSLANETQKATDEIAAVVQGIQDETREAVAAIDQVSQIIDGLAETSASVAGAMDEQNEATQEISRNVQDASTGTNEVTANIGGVNEAASETGRASGEVLNVAKELAERSQSMKGEIEVFLKAVRAT